MNHFLRLLSVALLLVNTNTSFAQWTQLSPGTNEHIHCVRYAPSGDVWAGTWNGIYRSSNSGSTFNFVTGINSTLGNSQIIGSFEDIHVTGPNSAISSGYFYLGNDLIIFGTSNNGASWSHNYHTNSGALPRYISAMDFDGAGNGVAVGGAGRAYKSSDNGTTWVAVTSGTTTLLEDVSWVNGSTFVSVSGSNIYRSTNNGTNWTSVLSLQTNIENISFARGTNTGYAGGFGTLKKSTDGGLTWVSMNLPAYNIRTIFTFSPDTVYVGAYDGVYRTITGGTYWEKFNMPNVKWVNDITFYDANNGMVAGDSGYVAITSNGGGLPMPISSFNLTGGNNCEGGTFQPNNLGDPAWTYQWLMNGSVVSTLHSPSLVLSPGGNVVLSLIASNNGFSDTSSTSFFISPIPVAQPFSVIRDTICTGGTGHFTIPNSQPNVFYRVYDGNIAVGTGTMGNGNSIVLSTAANQTIVKPYKIRGIITNVCGDDTLEVIDSIFISKPATNVTAAYYRDTVCTGDTTYMLVYNSQPGWEYYLGTQSFIKIQGNGGTIGIPVPAISSNKNHTVIASLISHGCTSQIGGTYLLTYMFASVNILPGTLMGAVNQPIAITSSGSGFNSWDWDFGPNATPASFSGANPTPVSFNTQMVDTIIITAKLNNTCEKIVKRPVYIYGVPVASSMDTCKLDTSNGGSLLTLKVRMDDYNNFYFMNYNASSSNFLFIPTVGKLDSAGNWVHFNSFQQLSNSSGMQGLPTGITYDRLGNTYISAHMVANAYWDFQGNYIRNKNALIKLDRKGKFQWAIESPAAEFTDLITINNRMYAVGRNVWDGCMMQTPKGGFTYTPTVNNKGDAFVMEWDDTGKILDFDAFGGTGSAGVTGPVPFRANVPLVNQFFDVDTLRQNLMASKASNGDMLICGMITTPTAGQIMKFGNATLSNNLPANSNGQQKSIFMTRYNASQGFTSAVNLLNGSPSFITNFVEDVNGNYVIIGKTKDRIITSAGENIFSNSTYDYQYLASFNPNGNLNWIVYADSMTFNSVGSNADGSVSVGVYMNTKFLLVDALNQAYNVSPAASIGSYMLRFSATGAFQYGDNVNFYPIIDSRQDVCGNYHSLFKGGIPVGYSFIVSTLSMNNNCSPSCYAAYDPNSLDASALSLSISDTTINGPSNRNLFVKIMNNASLPITAMDIRYQINNNAIQNFAWNGNLSTGASDSILLTAYNFNRSYNHVKVWVNQVNGSTDNQQGNDTVKLSQIVCSAPLSGTYSLGCDTCYFDTFMSSSKTLKRCGVSEPVKIAVVPGTYYEQLTVDSIPFSSSTDSIVWTSANGIKESVVLDFAANNINYYRNTIRLNRAHYCSFENMTIQNTSAAPFDAMQLDHGCRASISVNASSRIRILNNVIHAPKRSNSAGSVAQAIVMVGIMNNVVIADNFIDGGEVGIEMNYVTTGGYDVFVLRNELWQTNEIQLSGLKRLLGDGNKIRYISSAGSGGTSLHMFQCDSFVVKNNLISSEVWGGASLYLTGCDCQTVSPCLVYNNSVGYQPSWLPFESATLSGLNLDIIHNSFGNGVAIGGGMNAPTFRFNNNVVRSNSSFAIDSYDEIDFIEMNHNRYISNGVPIKIINDNVDYDLGTWKAFSGLDLQSDSVTASFRTLSDMHLLNAVAMPGVPFAGITTDMDGEIRSVTTPTIGADEFSVATLLSSVWPGDCDSTKSVDNFDILQVGLNFNKYYTSRPTLSDAWVSQPSLLWNKQQGNGTNMNHVDCNGDGLINLLDTVAIFNNYGMSHPAANPQVQSISVGPDLSIFPVGTTFTGGDTVHLKLMAGTSGLMVNDIGALGFKLEIPPSLIVPNTFVVTYVNNWMCPDTNCILFANMDESTGVAAISMARKDGTGVTGFGEVADVSFVVNAGYSGNPTVNVNINPYQAFDPISTAMPFTTNGGTITIVNTSVEELSLMDGVRLFPNPTKSLSTILFNWKGNGTDKMSIRVLDLSGRIVGNPIQLIPHYGSNRVEVVAETFANGIYFIELRCDNESKVLKMLKY
ncbi:MAG: T9SS type A sorting domain-containing protein [Bacteroidetes bacterium]|nr:T9SS type A sorting domain-containing protein [Bacteroidota bacterium]